MKNDSVKDEIVREIFDELNRDLVYYGWLAQGALHMEGGEASLSENVDSLLTDLLSTGIVEVGETRALLYYVEFIAWAGSVEERVQRAHDEVSRAETQDKAFAFWLCLRKNVDRFERARPFGT